ncbi:MAG: xylulose kinase [Candidatus Omnitrophica bacterium]|nr:xylulose kinase [Candidatus Omnitrophota bacterium]
MKKFVAAIDLGTTYVKAGVFDLSGKELGASKGVCPIVFYKDGRIEQDVPLIIKKAFACLKDAIHKSSVDPKNIISVSVSNQRATVIPLDNNGCSLGNAVSWQDMRGGRCIRDLRRKISDRRYYNITGIPNNPVFTLGKILWFNDSGLSKKIARFVLFQEYLLKQLGAEDFFLDWSNASLTGMFDIKKFDWSAEVLETAGIDRDKLSVLIPSGKKVGVVSGRAAKMCGLAEGTGIVSGGGDQQCAGVGAGAVRPGAAEFTLGTAGVLLAYSDKIVRDPEMRVSCCAHAVPGKWEVEGLQNAAGGSLGWVNKIISDSKFSHQFFDKVSNVVPGAGNVLFYPFLAGASAPSWNTEARAMFLGLAHFHGKAHLVRAVLEGVSMETKEIMDVFEELGIPLKNIKVTGGCSRIAVWNRMQADIYGKPVYALHNSNASLLGAAILAAVGAGAFSSVKSAADRMVGVREMYEPEPENVEKYKYIYGKYRKIYSVFKKTGLFKTICGDNL